MPWWIATSLLANAAIISVEYLNRQQPDLGSALMRTWPLIILAQVCLYFSWHYAPSLMVAWATFALGNSLMRLVMVGSALGEPMKMTWTVGGIALMMLGSYLVKVGTVR